MKGFHLGPGNKQQIGAWNVLGAFFKFIARYFKPLFPLIMYERWGYNFSMFSPISHTLVTVDRAIPVVVYRFDILIPE